MKDKIFLLGGSPLQIELLKAAKDRYHVVVIDGNASCALRKEADEFVHLDFSNTDELYKLALIKRPALILTMASEPGNLSAAIVSAQLGLKYNPVDIVYATINKIPMKAKLNYSQIPTAPHVVILKEHEDYDRLHELGFPLVVKPSQSSAGRGVRLINFIQEIEAAIAEAKRASRDGCALVEKFIPGDQYSVETISCNGVHNVIGITREYFGAPPYFAETQQLYPAEIEADKAREIKHIVLKTLDAFEIRYGACHVELRVCPEGKIYIVEIASRIGGWRSELIRKASGIDYADLLLQAYEKDSLKIEAKENKYCLVKMIYSQEDLYREQVLRNSEKYVVSPITWLKDSVRQSQNSLMDSAGYYFVESKSIEDSLNAL